MDDATYMEYLMGTDTDRLHGPESGVDRTIKYESENNHQFSGYRSVRADSDDNDSGAPILGAGSRKAVKDYRGSGNLNRTTRIPYPSSSTEIKSRVVGIDPVDRNKGLLQPSDLIPGTKVTSGSRDPLYCSGSSVSFPEGAVNSGYESSQSGGVSMPNMPCAQCSQMLDTGNYNRQTLQGQPVCNHCAARQVPPRVGAGGGGALPKTVTCMVCEQATDLNYSRRIDSGVYSCVSCEQKQSQALSSLQHNVSDRGISSLQRSLRDHGQQGANGGLQTLRR